MGKPLRIAHLIGALDFGGVENMALLLLKGLPRDEFEHFIIYTSEHRPQREGEFRQAAQGFETIGYRRFHWLSLVTRLRRYFREQRIDAALCHNFGHHPWIGLAARWAGVKRIYTIVASSPCVNARARLKNQIKGWLGRLTCNLEIAVSPQVAGELEAEIGLPAKRLRTILNCCMTEEISQRAEKRRRLREDHRPTLLMVARMEAAKDHEALLQAVGELRRRGRETRLRLAGDGPLRGEIEGAAQRLGIQKEVEFLGVRHDIPELLGESDVFILASKTEGLSIALIEAMSAGIPVISTDLPSCREVLEGGRCGVLVPAGNSLAMADAIERLLADPAYVEGLISSSAERVKRCYDPRLTIDAYARLLRGELDTVLDSAG